MKNFLNISDLSSHELRQIIEEGKVKFELEHTVEFDGGSEISIPSCSDGWYTCVDEVGCFE